MLTIPMMFTAQAATGGGGASAFIDVPFSYDSGFNDVSGNFLNSTDYGGGFIANWGFPKQGGYCLRIAQGSQQTKFIYPSTTFSGNSTHSVWIKTATSSQFSFYSIFRHVITADSSKYVGVNTFDSYSFAFRGGSNIAQVPSNSWNHVCCVFENGGTTHKLYVNGSLSSSLTGQTNYTYQFKALLGGGGDDYYFARMRSWNVALDATQVLAEYNRA